MNIYIFDCSNPKGHFGYGHSDVCYFPVSAGEVADRAFSRYAERESSYGMRESVLLALESFQPKPHPDAGYSEPIRD